MSTVVLFCWCHSDSGSVLLYFTFHTCICKWKNADIKRLKCFKSFNDFLCIYLDEGRGLLLHLYVWEHIVSLTTEPLDGVYDIC